LPIHGGRRLVHLADEAIAMVIEVRECRIDLLGTEIGVLTKDLLGRPAVVVMLAREMNHLVSRPVDAGIPSASRIRCGY
jgi:hypothetical protein